jgi:hypothetical protein
MSTGFFQTVIADARRARSRAGHPAEALDAQWAPPVGEESPPRPADPPAVGGMRSRAANEYPEQQKGAAAPKEGAAVHSRGVAASGPQTDRGFEGTGSAVIAGEVRDVSMSVRRSFEVPVHASASTRVNQPVTAVREQPDASAKGDRRPPSSASDVSPATSAHSSAPALRRAAREEQSSAPSDGDRPSAAWPLGEPVPGTPRDGSSQDLGMERARALSGADEAGGLQAHADRTGVTRLAGLVVPVPPAGAATGEAGVVGPAATAPVLTGVPSESGVAAAPQVPPSMPAAVAFRESAGPQIVIGTIEVVVEAPRPAAPTAPMARSDSGLASRHYLRGL